MHYVDDGPSDGPPVVLGTDHTLRKEKDRMTKEQTTGAKTADLTTLLDRSRSFAEQFEAGDLKILPRMSTILLPASTPASILHTSSGSDSATHSSYVTQATGSPPQ